jgi:hypothetical protein
MIDRSEFADARPRDVALLKVLLVTERRQLTKAIALQQYRIPARRFRAAVAELRRQGVPLVSFSAAGSTYRLASSETEAEAFVASELMSRATDLLEQSRQIRAHARGYFEPIQPELITSR